MGAPSAGSGGGWVASRLNAWLGLGLPADQRRALMTSLLICVLYGATSSVIALVFKALLSGYRYQAKFALLVFQLVITLAFCFVAKRWFKGVPGLEVPDIDTGVLRKAVVPGVMFVANIVVGWYGLQLVNVPMFLAIRRTNAAFTLVAEYVILHNVASERVVGSVGLIVLGAVVAGAESLQRDWVGFLYTLGNNLFTSISMSMTKRFSDETGTRGFGVVMYNALVALPLCLVGAIMTNEYDLTFNPTLFPPGQTVGFWVAVVAASSLGVFMSYIVFLCTTHNSPLATSITGNIKDVASTVLGAALFGDFVATAYTITGLILSFVGAAVFSVTKVQEAQAAARAKSMSSAMAAGGGGPGSGGVPLGPGGATASALPHAAKLGAHGNIDATSPTAMDAREAMSIPRHDSHSSDPDVELGGGAHAARHGGANGVVSSQVPHMGVGGLGPISSARLSADSVKYRRGDGVTSM